MKKLLLPALLLTLLTFTATAHAEDIPDMKGTWVGKASHMATLQWGVVPAKSNKNTIVIEKQLGRVFSGYKTWTMKGKTLSEKIVGGVASDGEIYIAEEVDGQFHGDISKDGKTLTIFYVESGAKAKIIEQSYIKAD